MSSQATMRPTRTGILRGGSVRLFATAAHRYWGASSYVWNNTGDKATLKNNAGAKVDTCTWGSSGPGYTSC